MAFIAPDIDDIKKACGAFDTEDGAAERALGTLLQHFPHNQQHEHVLLKTVAINALYATSVFALRNVAAHIVNQHIDGQLSAGDPDLVERIARVTLQGKPRMFFSFATKYCSWHQQDKYPIWDSRVERFFKRWKRETGFASDWNINGSWTYRRFRDAVDEFKTKHGLDTVSYKDLDKYIWMQEEAPTADSATN